MIQYQKKKEYRWCWANEQHPWVFHAKPRELRINYIDICDEFGNSIDYKTLIPSFYIVNHNYSIMLSIIRYGLIRISVNKMDCKSPLVFNASFNDTIRFLTGITNFNKQELFVNEITFGYQHIRYCTLNAAPWKDEYRSNQVLLIVNCLSQNISKFFDEYFQNQQKVIQINSTCEMFVDIRSENDKRLLLRKLTI